MKTKLAFVLLAMAISGSIAFAKDKDEAKQVVRAETAEQFDTMAASVRKEMQADGKYEYAKPQDKVEVSRELDEMAAMLKKSGTVSAMSDAERIKLFNIQEKINTTLNHNDSDRLVCSRETPVGSHLPVTTCKRYGDIARSRDETRKFFEKRQTNVQSSPTSN